MTVLRRIILLALPVLLLSIPAAAQAHGGEGPEYRVETRSGGYRIAILAFASTLRVEVARNERARDAGAATYYLARASTGGGRIASRIGSLGSVSMTFHPSGPERADKTQCDTSLTRSRPGTFVGDLRFRGEGGYVTLNAHRLRGVELRRGPSCNPAGAEALEAKGKFDYLSAGFRRGLAAAYFSAYMSPSGRSYYNAEAESGGDEYAVQRVAFAAAPDSTFATDDSLSSANLTPPFPFGGTGSFQRAADGAPLWTGSLTATFPGAPDFPLTGPLFKVRLTRSW